MKQEVIETIKKALESLQAQWGIERLPDIDIEIPKNESMGDVATTVALGLTKILKKPPKKIAEEIFTELTRHVVGMPGPIESIEIAGPGFINLRLKKEFLHAKSTDAIYAGEAFLAGGQWQGNMQRISTRTCTGDECITADPWTYATNRESWTSSTLFDSPLPLTAAPAASLDGDRNLWIFFGTGRYFGFSDRAAHPPDNLFFGIKDPCYRGECTSAVPFNQLYHSSPVIVYKDGTVGGTAITTWNDLVHEIGQRQGWYITLSPGGECVLSKPSLLGGLLSFTAYTPDEDLCGIQGLSTLYSLYYQTGTAWVKPLFIAANGGSPVYGGDGQHGNGDPREAMQTKLALPKGMSESPAMHLGNTVTLVLPVSGTALESIPLALRLQVKSGMGSWREE